MIATEKLVVRNYEPKDLEAIKAIHEKTQIDYKFPNISAPLFIVKKVIELDGVVVMAGGMYLQAECYLWSSPDEWGTPQEKLEAIQLLDQEVIEATWLQGVDCAVLWLPPGMERFGERLTKDLGFKKDRDNWVSYSKPTGAK